MKTNCYNALIFKNNYIKLEIPLITVNRSLVNSDDKPTPFGHFDISDNKILIKASAVTATRLFDIQQNLSDIIFSGNKIKIDVATIGTGTTLVSIFSNNYVSAKRNEIQIVDNSPVSIFTVNNNTAATAIYDIDENDVVYLGADSADNFILSPETNGAPTIRIRRNAINGWI